MIDYSYYSWRNVWSSKKSFRHRKLEPPNENIAEVVLEYHLEEIPPKSFLVERIKHSAHWQYLVQQQ